MLGAKLQRARRQFFGIVRHTNQREYAGRDQCLAVGTRHAALHEGVLCEAGFVGRCENRRSKIPSAQGVVIGFNIRAIPQARTIAKRDKVDIRYYSIIYELIDDMKKMLSGLLTPDTKEEIIGHAEVRDTFSSSKLGTIAGCFVTNGFVSNSAKIRLVREGKIIHEGEVGSLKRFKDDVKEVRENYECGISFKDYSYILVKDEIEFYVTKEVQKEL